MLREFLDFIKRGNVIDLAVAVIIGTAFNAIVQSLVKDIIMPLIGIIIGGVNFTELAITVGGAQVTYGAFIQAIINFLIIAFVVFLIVRSINQMRARFEKPKEVVPVAPPEEVVLLTQIRDLLREGPRAPMR